MKHISYIISQLWLQGLKHMIVFNIFSNFHSMAAHAGVDNIFSEKGKLLSLREYNGSRLTAHISNAERYKNKALETYFSKQ